MGISRDCYWVNSAIYDVIFLESLQKDVNLETMLAVLQTTCAQTEEESEVSSKIVFQS